MAIEQGSCFYIDCREPHRYENADADTWEFLWLHFNGPGAEHYFEDFHSAEHPVLMPQDTFLVESTLRRILSLARKKTVYTDILTASLITKSCDGTYDSKYDRFQTDFCDAGLCESKY